MILVRTPPATTASFAGGVLASGPRSWTLSLAPWHRLPSSHQESSRASSTGRRRRASPSRRVNHGLILAIARAKTWMQGFLDGRYHVRRVIRSTQLPRGESPDYGRPGAVNPPDQPHDITTHQSGHRTLVGVRVAFNTISCSLGVRCFAPKRAKEASMIQGSSSIRAVSRYRSSLVPMRRHSTAVLTLPGDTME